MNIPEDSLRADRINAEVRAILEDSASAKKPLLRLTELILRLKGDATWDPEDIDQVQAASLRILTAIIQAAGGADDGSTITRGLAAMRKPPG